jgi:hypothetical protein
MDKNEKLAVAVFWDEVAWVAIDARHNIAAQGDSVVECLERFAKTVGAELTLQWVD